MRQGKVEAKRVCPWRGQLAPPAPAYWLYAHIKVQGQNCLYTLII